MELVLAQPRGFCAGVTRAIEIVEHALERHGAPVYVLHEIVHNRHVVADLASRGAVFVESLTEIPPASVVVFSAHGVAQRVAVEADARGLHVIDATCPLVAKVHLQAERYVRQGRELVVIGHRSHPEVEGTLGRIGAAVAHVVCSLDDIASLSLPAGAPVAYVTQTTLSVDDTRELVAALERRFPGIVGPEVEDICYATHNRQRAVRALAADVKLVLVVGARNSSNSNRLREVAAREGVAAHLVEEAAEIDPGWLSGVDRVGLTAGASAPEHLVSDVARRLTSLGVTSIRQMPGAIENQRFKLPSIGRSAVR